MYSAGECKLILFLLPTTTGTTPKPFPFLFVARIKVRSRCGSAIGTAANTFSLTGPDEAYACAITALPFPKNERSVWEIHLSRVPNDGYVYIGVVADPLLGISAENNGRKRPYVSVMEVRMALQRLEDLRSRQAQESRAASPAWNNKAQAQEQQRLIQELMLSLNAAESKDTASKARLWEAYGGFDTSVRGVGDALVGGGGWFPNSQFGW